jgi:hypothetical protein
VDLTAIVESPQDWIVAARLVANDLVQAFGLIEVPQINADGALRVRHFGVRVAGATAWAEGQSIPVDQSMISG